MYCGSLRNKLTYYPFVGKAKGPHVNYFLPLHLDSLFLVLPFVDLEMVEVNDTAVGGTVVVVAIGSSAVAVGMVMYLVEHWYSLPQVNVACPHDEDAVESAQERSVEDEDGGGDLADAAAAAEGSENIEDQVD